VLRQFSGFAWYRDAISWTFVPVAVVGLSSKLGKGKCLIRLKPCFCLRQE
jgi:hypothetical protein